MATDIYGRTVDYGTKLSIRRINFIGGPGVGKSTISAFLYSQLKIKHASVELAQEYIKGWAYEKRVVNSGDQTHIFSEQQRRELVPLRAGVGAVISDSPLTLCAVYGKVSMPQDWELFLLLAKAHERDFPSVNIFLDRDMALPYQELGRYQTKEQALEMDKEILNTLSAFRIPMIRRLATDQAGIVKLATDLLPASIFETPTE